MMFKAVKKNNTINNKNKRDEGFVEAHIYYQYIYVLQSGFSVKGTPDRTPIILLDKKWLKTFVKKDLQIDYLIK